jgi:hypothetical protein
MKSKKLKGGVMDWVAAISGLLIVSILWIVFSSKIILPSYGLMPMAQTITDPNAQTAVQLFSVVWGFWPIVMILGFVLLVFVASQRRSPETWYG